MAKKSELQKLAEKDWEIELKSKEIFDRDWSHRFQAAETKEEFNVVRRELRQECGVGNELPGSLEVSVLLIWSKFFKEDN